MSLQAGAGESQSHGTRHKHDIPMQDAGDLSCLMKLECAGAHAVGSALRWAVTLRGQSCAEAGGWRQEREWKGADLRLLERSVFSDRMVFVRAVHESKYMSDLELSVYNSW